MAQKGSFDSNFNFHIHMYKKILAYSCEFEHNDFNIHMPINVS